VSPDAQMFRARTVTRSRWPYSRTASTRCVDCHSGGQRRSSTWQVRGDGTNKSSDVNVVSSCLVRVSDKYVKVGHQVRESRRTHWTRRRSLASRSSSARYAMRPITRTMWRRRATGQTVADRVSWSRSPSRKLSPPISSSL